MIVKMRKFLIYGNRVEIDRFFPLAQQAGFLEFIGLCQKKSLELPENAKIILGAIKVAKHHFIQPKKAPSHWVPLEIAQKILSLQSHVDLLYEESRLLEQEISRIAIFGHFSKDDLFQIEQEGRRILQFFCMRSSLARETGLPEELIFIGTEYDLDYFVAVNREKKKYPKMMEILIERPVGELRDRLSTVQREIAVAEGDLRVLCNALPVLEKGFNECLNEYTLRLAQHEAIHPIEGGGIFAIEAWVPENRIVSLQELVSGMQVECEPIAVESSDRVPTCIENQGVSRIGEDLIYIYDTPSPNDQDPSAWVLWFFALFFAMIISDAGYGVLLLGTALLMKWKISADAPASLHRFTKLLSILSVSCILWGCATASFFGIEIKPDSPLRKMSFIHGLAVKKAQYHLREKDEVYHEITHRFPQAETAADGQDFLRKTAYRKEGKERYRALEEFYNNILLELSLVVGIFHLSLSFFRWTLRNPAGLGWVCFMVGGYLYCPTYLEATTIANFAGIVSKPLAKTLGLQLLALGPCFVLLTALLQRKGAGALFELTHGIQIFSDVLSYLRLYALALAGMVMAETVNTTLGIEMGAVGTVAVVLLGHFLNITLSLMSAAIHGLRLNFLEWYRYSFEGGGRMFNPLRIRK